MTRTPETAVVVFDLGGVVCKFEPEARLDALADATGLDPERIKAAVWDSGLDAALDRGERQLPDALQAVISALGNRLDEDALLTSWAKAFVVDQEVVELARSLDRQTAIFTNNGPLLEACLDRGLLGLDPFFDPILFAGQLGATKPDPIAYERAADALGKVASALLLIDDAPANVAGARRAGWQSILYDGDPGACTLLRQRLQVAGVTS